MHSCVIKAEFYSSRVLLNFLMNNKRKRRGVRAKEVEIENLLAHREERITELVIASFYRHRAVARWRFIDRITKARPTLRMNTPHKLLPIYIYIYIYCIAVRWQITQPRAPHGCALRSLFIIVNIDSVDIIAISACLPEILDHLRVIVHNYFAGPDLKTRYYFFSFFMRLKKWSAMLRVSIIALYFERHVFAGRWVLQ